MQINKKYLTIKRYFSKVYYDSILPKIQKISTQTPKHKPYLITSDNIEFLSIPNYSNNWKNTTLNFFSGCYYSNIDSIHHNAYIQSLTPVLKDTYPSTHRVQDYNFRHNDKLHITTIKSKHVYSNKAFLFFCDNHQSEELWKYIFYSKNNPIPIDAEIIIVNGNKINIYVSKIENTEFSSKADSIEDYIDKYEDLEPRDLNFKSSFSVENVQEILDAEVRIQNRGEEKRMVYQASYEDVKEFKMNHSNLIQQHSQSQEYYSYFWKNQKIYNARLNIILENVFNRYNDVIIGGMGEGFKMVNSKLGYMIKNEIEAIKSLNTHLLGIGIDPTSLSGIELERYSQNMINRKYSFYEKIKGFVSIDQIANETIQNFITSKQLKYLFIGSDKSKSEIDEHRISDYQYFKAYIMNYQELKVGYELIAPMRSFMHSYFPEKQVNHKFNQKKYNEIIKNYIIDELKPEINEENVRNIESKIYNKKLMNIKGIDYRDLINAQIR